MYNFFAYVNTYYDNDIVYLLFGNNIPLVQAELIKTILITLEIWKGKYVVCYILDLISINYSLKFSFSPYISPTGTYSVILFMYGIVHNFKDFDFFKFNVTRSFNLQGVIQYAVPFPACLFPA